jgi:hypothetical protein
MSILALIEETDSRFSDMVNDRVRQLDEEDAGRSAATRAPGPFALRTRGTRRFFQRLHRHEVRVGTITHSCNAVLC